VPGPPGRALAGLYTRAVEHRNQRFDAGRGVVTFDRPVISVGNLSLGGTGKTPMVAKIIALLREHGHDPCIAMRGYASARNAGGRSDEAEVYRAAFDDLPIVAQPNRVEGLIRLFGSERGDKVDCIVLDDGFQHRRIARQLDLVLVDASHNLFASGVFPAGRLREPLQSLRRATHITITHAEMVGESMVEALHARLGEVAPGAAISIASHEWVSLAIEAPGGARQERVSWLAGRRVVAACGIGRPEAFLAAIERAGARLAGSVVLRDHDRFAPRALRRISSAAAGAGAEAIVVTEKDWSKLEGRAVAWPCAVVRPRLEVSFRAGWETLAGDLLAAASSAPE
jgi:tetraacyldisaccharide 4'-kinase